MRALVVHESTFGNTEKVARSVGMGLSDCGFEVVVHEVSLHPEIAEREFDVVVVGGPARGRSQARGIYAWLDSLSPVKASVCAAFETRAASRPTLPTTTAYAATRALRRVCGPAVALPRSFALEGDLGPVVVGELTRAREWGHILAALAGAPVPAVLPPQVPVQGRKVSTDSPVAATVTPG